MDQTSRVDWERSPLTLVEQRQLACTGTRTERVALAQHSRITEVLWILVRDSAAPVREALAANPATPAELIDRLCADHVTSVRAAAARRTTNADLLADLVVDRSSRVWSNALRAPALCPEQVLERVRLADAADRSGSHTNTHQRVRILVQHPRCSSDLLEHLIADRTLPIRLLCAAHPNLRRRAIVRARYAPASLLDGPEMSIWRRWRLKLRRLRATEPLDLALLANPNAPRWMLGQSLLMGRSQVDIAVAIAENPRCPWWLQRRLCRCSRRTHIALARNPAASRSTLRRMLGGRYALWLRVLADGDYWWSPINPNGWARRRLRICHAQRPHGWEQAILGSILRHQNTPRLVARAYGADPSLVTRRILAERANLPRGLRRRLLLHADPAIVAAALRGSRRFPIHVKMRLFGAVIDSASPIVAAAVAHPRIGERLLVHLALHAPAVDVRCVAYANPQANYAARSFLLHQETDPRVWSLIAADGEIGSATKWMVLQRRLERWPGYTRSCDPYRKEVLDLAHVLMRTGLAVPEHQLMDAVADTTLSTWLNHHHDAYDECPIQADLDASRVHIEAGLYALLLARDTPLDESLTAQIATHPFVTRLLPRLLHRDDTPLALAAEAVSLLPPSATERYATMATNPLLLVRALARLSGPAQLRVLERGLWREPHIWEGAAPSTREWLRTQLLPLALHLADVAPSNGSARRARRLVQWFADQSPGTTRIAPAHGALSALLDDHPVEENAAA